MGRREGKKREGTYRRAAGALFLLLGSLLLLFCAHTKIGPNIEAVSRLKAQGMITEIINDTVREKFSGRAYEKELFLMERDRDGKVILVQSNTRLINELVADFAVALQKRYDEIAPREMNLTYGVLFGSRLFPQGKSGIKVKILPLSVSKCDFETSFQTQGINQTKYRIYLVVDSSIRVLEPFSSKSFRVKNRILLSEVVILGDVPGSYTAVPEKGFQDWR